MRRFSYEARDQASNKIVKSSIQAESETAAARLLIKQGFVPINVKEQIGDGGFLSRITGRITTKDKVVFTRQLATLIGAGLPLSQSLHTVMEQTNNKQLQAFVQEVVGSVEGGRSLSDSFAEHPRVFNEVFISLMKAGELSGTLDDSLQRVAAQQEKDAATSSKIRGAMTYPLIVLFVIFGVLLFMLFTVVPQVEKLYDDLGKELPWITKFCKFCGKHGFCGRCRFRATPGGIVFAESARIRLRAGHLRIAGCRCGPYDVRAGLGIAGFRRLRTFRRVRKPVRGGVAISCRSAGNDGHAISETGSFARNREIAGTGSAVHGISAFSGATVLPTVEAGCDECGARDRRLPQFRWKTLRFGRGKNASRQLFGRGHQLPRYRQRRICDFGAMWVFRDFRGA